MVTKNVARRQKMSTETKNVTPELPTEIQEKPRKLTANQIAIAALSAQGLTQTQIGKELGISKTWVNQTHTALVKSGKYDLTNNSMVRGAFKTIKALSKGEPVGTIKEVKDSTALRASELIYDRFQPVVQHVQTQSRSISVSISLDSYKQSKDVDNAPQKVSSD